MPQPDDTDPDTPDAPDEARPRRRRWVRRVLAGLLLVPLVAAGALWIDIRTSMPSLDRAKAMSATILDRHDRLLRAFTTADDRWRLPLDVADTDPRYLAMLMAYEDKRFRQHHGVDWLAVGRAGKQLLRHGRIVSGASTLTMQTARLLTGHHERTGIGKLRQMVRALQLEQHLSKNRILGLYLRLAPFGGNIEGTRAASLAYFGKEPRRLSVAEAALLVAIPQSPEARRPDRHPDAARRARNRVIQRVLAAGVITAAEAAEARRERVPHVRRPFPMFAPHLSDSELKRDPKRGIHRMTLDRDIQGQLEGLARERAAALGPKLSVAILAADHRTGEVLAHVGSAAYLDESRQGAIDMTDAVRSPGSTLKPVIYGLAFERGIAHPETLIEDRPARFGLYQPKNFDEDFHGTVTIREALAQSLNIPAVKVLNILGPSRLLGRLHRIRMVTALPPATPPTLAIALGGIGLKLTDLATLYASLARGGEAVHLTHDRAAPKRYGASRPARRLLSPVAAWYVTDILKDAPPPANARGGGIAYKTGTSYGFRDAWAAGYDGRHTVVVWVGRPDGTATPGLTGRTAAAPILFDAFARLAERPTPFAPPPPGVRRGTTATLPPPLRHFKEPGDDAPDPGPYLEPPVQIAFPIDRSDLETEPDEKPSIILKAQGGALPLTWLVDGQPIAADPARREVEWSPEGRGFARISVIDARGRTDRVQVRVK
jgi:penicillin-binding protein 1C